MTGGVLQGIVVTGRQNDEVQTYRAGLKGPGDRIPRVDDPEVTTAHRPPTRNVGVGVDGPRWTRNEGDTGVILAEKNRKVQNG